MGGGWLFSFFGDQKKRKAPPRGARKLFIPETLYRRMINQCMEERPLEACGLLTGVVDQVEAAYATDNEQRSPVLYQVDPMQVMQVMRLCQNYKHEVIGIYHSHVQTPAVPSLIDIQQAYWPEAFYLIVSLAKNPPEVRAWRIVDQQVTEHQVIVRPGTAGQWHDLRQAVRSALEPMERPDIP